MAESKMKRRTFLKGLGIALLAPTAFLKGEVEAAVPVSKDELPMATRFEDVRFYEEDNTSIHDVSWGEEMTATLRRPMRKCDG